MLFGGLLEVEKSESFPPFVLVAVISKRQACWVESKKLVLKYGT